MGTRTVVLVLATAMMFCWLAGCNSTDRQDSSVPSITEYASWRAWQGIRVGSSTSADVATVFQTPVDAKDRYAYALKKGQGTDNWFLMMVDLDEDGIVTGKYYWQWTSSDPSPIIRLENWEMGMDTQIPAHVLQEYTATLGPREEEILEYFGRKLYTVAGQFEHLKDVFDATASMKRIYTLGAVAYGMRPDKQLLLSEHGFVFDGDVFGDKCTMSLKAVDKRAGWYYMVLKGGTSRNFFTGS